MITKKGKPWRAPYWGNQLMAPCILVNVDCTMPIAIPVMTVGQTFRNLPMSAAPRAGIRNPKVKMPDDSWIVGDAKMITKAPINELNTKLAPARKVGEYPRSTAPFSLSAAALVTSPTRV